MAAARRARWPVAGAFAWFGAVVGSFAIIALDLQESLGLGPGAFGALLSVGFALGAAAQLAGGASIERAGEASALRVAALLSAATLVAVAVAPTSFLLGLAVIAVLTANGTLNATVNASAAHAVAGDTRRFVRFHACFSGGALAGAVLTAVIGVAGGSWRLVWLLLGAVGAGIAVSSSGDGRPSAVTDREGSPSVRSVLALLRTSAIRDVALLLCTAVAAAGAVDTWGVRYLRVDRGASVAGGAGVYAVGQLVAVFARARLGPRSDASGARPVATAGALLAFGLLLEWSAPIDWLAGVGLAVAAVAAALVVPLLLARAGVGERPGATIAAVGAVGQLGFVLGPVVIGAATSISGSGSGLLVAVGLAIVTAIGALHRLSVDATTAVRDCGTAMTSGGRSA